MGTDQGVTSVAEALSRGLCGRYGLHPPKVVFHYLKHFLYSGTDYIADRWRAQARIARSRRNEALRPARRAKEDRGMGMPKKPSRATAVDPRMATTLERGLKILAAFRANDDGPLGNSEIAKRANLPKATVSRLTYTLTKLGYLLHDPKRGYALGPGVLGPAYVFYSRLDIRQVARPHLRRLATRPGVYLSLGVRHELKIISLESLTADWPSPLTGLFNAQAPIARTAAGHAYLASLPTAERQLLLEALEAKHDKNDWKQVQQQIARDIAAVADHGYCMVRGEWHPTLNAVGVPLNIPARNLTLVLSAGGPSQLLGSDALSELGIALRDVAREIEREAGGGSMTLT